MKYKYPNTAYQDMKKLQFQKKLAMILTILNVIVATIVISWINGRI
jgi:hypothetical protein